jgi:hypothetical protein
VVVSLGVGRSSSEMVSIVGASLVLLVVAIILTIVRFIRFLIWSNEHCVLLLMSCRLWWWSECHWCTEMNDPSERREDYCICFLI